jgi:thymidine phosphorylase
LHTDTPDRFASARESLEGAYAIGDAAPPERPLIIERVG